MTFFIQASRGYKKYVSKFPCLPLKVNRALVFFVVLLVFIAIDASEASAIPTTDTVSNIATVFKQKASTWEPILRRYALSLFRWLLIIDVCWLGIRMSLKQAEIQEVLVEFVRLVIFAAFMFTLVIYYKTWANAIIGGLSIIAENELHAPSTDLGSILDAGFSIFKGAVAKIKEVDLAQIPVAILGSFCALGVSIIFAMIAAQVVLIKCEAYIVLNAGAILLGFGGSQFTKDYAINFMRYALAVAMKLFVMQLLVALGMDFITDFQTAPLTLDSLIILIACSIVLLALVNSIPDIVSGIINGAHVSSGQAITSAVTAASTATIAAMTALKGSLTGGKNAVDAEIGRAHV